MAVHISNERFYSIADVRHTVDLVSDAEVLGLLYHVGHLFKYLQYKQDLFNMLSICKSLTSADNTRDCFSKPFKNLSTVLRIYIF